jgi:hypothetical protein
MMSVANARPVSRHSSRMPAVDARPTSHHPSRVPAIIVHSASHHSPRQPRPPPSSSSFVGRPSQGPHHPSQAELGRVPSHHSPQAVRVPSHQSSRAVCGPSAGQDGGFVNVGRVPPHAADVVESRQPSRRPSAVLPSRSLNPFAHSGQMVRRPSAYPQVLAGSRRPSAAVDQRPQQHNGQRPDSDLAI